MMTPQEITAAEATEIASNFRSAVLNTQLDAVFSAVRKAAREGLYQALVSFAQPPHPKLSASLENLGFSVPEIRSGSSEDVGGVRVTWPSSHDAPRPATKGLLG